MEKERIKELEDTLKAIEVHLTNLQPHIVQACVPGHAQFVDTYIDAALEEVKKVMR